MATPADLVKAASRAGAQVKKMPYSPGVRGGTVNKEFLARQSGGAGAGPAGRVATTMGDSPAGAPRFADKRGILAKPEARDSELPAPAAPPRTVQGREVNPDGASITGRGGNVQQLGAAAQRRLAGVGGGGAPAFAPPPAAPPNTAEMANKLRGFKLAMGGPVYTPGPADDEMALAVNARPELAGALDAYERGPQGAPPMEPAPDMPGAPPAGVAGLFDSLGRVGAGLPPGAGPRPRPMPFSRPSNAMGGF